MHYLCSSSPTFFPKRENRTAKEGKENRVQWNELKKISLFLSQEGMCSAGGQIVLQTRNNSAGTQRARLSTPKARKEVVYSRRELTVFFLVGDTGTQDREEEQK